MFFSAHTVCETFSCFQLTFLQKKIYVMCYFFPWWFSPFLCIRRISDFNRWISWGFFSYSVVGNDDHKDESSKVILTGKKIIFSTATSSCASLTSLCCCFLLFFRFFLFLNLFLTHTTMIKKIFFSVKEKTSLTLMWN